MTVAFGKISVHRRQMPKLEEGYEALLFIYEAFSRIRKGFVMVHYLMSIPSKCLLHALLCSFFTVCFRQTVQCNCESDLVISHPSFPAISQLLGIRYCSGVTPHFFFFTACTGGKQPVPPLPLS